MAAAKDLAPRVHRSECRARARAPRECVAAYRRDHGPCTAAAALSPWGLRIGWLLTPHPPPHPTPWLVWQGVSQVRLERGFRACCVPPGFVPVADLDLDFPLVREDSDLPGESRIFPGRETRITPGERELGFSW
jgi:hypothetical protein